MLPGIDVWYTFYYLLHSLCGMARGLFFPFLRRRKRCQRVIDRRPKSIPREICFQDLDERDSPSVASGAASCARFVCLPVCLSSGFVFHVVPPRDAPFSEVGVTAACCVCLVLSCDLIRSFWLRPFMCFLSSESGQRFFGQRWSDEHAE